MEPKTCRDRHIYMVLATEAATKIHKTLAYDKIYLEDISRKIAIKLWERRSKDDPKITNQGGRKFTRRNPLAPETIPYFM